MATAGRILTGFSKPYVATYAASGTTVTYSGCVLLGRGVNVSVEASDAGDDNIFYADNQAAETVAGIFGGGTATLTIDGLIDSTRKLILGLPNADQDGWTAYGDDMSVPYVGIGFIARYQAEGTSTYVPYVLTKAKFSVPSDSAATQEDSIDWQTTELTANLLRDDTTNHNWKLIGQEYASEALAETALTAKLGLT